MESIYRITLVIAGVINLLPSLIAFLPQKISESYGVDVPNVNYELLLRHRAVLFAIVGGLLIYAAIAKKNYDLAFVVGMVSMVSFVILYQSIGGVNPELTKVMKIDIGAIVILLLGYLLFKF